VGGPPEDTRHGPPAFEHHQVLPQVEVGTALATVLVGALAGATSPARRDTPVVGLDLSLRTGASEVPLEAAFEHAVVVEEGEVEIDGRTVAPGHLAYLGPGRDEIRLSATDPTRLLLLGGEPLLSPIVVWWNFVGRSREELGEAGREWNAGSERFGTTTSRLARISAPRPPWAGPPA
jgi:quercetin 2,3-dioxygenase